MSAPDGQQWMLVRYSFTENPPAAETLRSTVR